MLEELSKDDKKWRITAYCYCKDKQLADDIVNDMYIQLYESGKKYSEINQLYVQLTIRNLWLHHLRKVNKDKKYIDFSCELKDLRVVDDKELLQDRKVINEALNELSFYDREILLHTSERSLRKNRDYLGLTLDVLFYSRKKALKRLEETKTIKKNKSA